MSRVHKVATVQFEPTMFEKQRNIARLLEVCEAAALAGSALALPAHSRGGSKTG